MAKKTTKSSKGGSKKRTPAKSARAPSDNPSRLRNLARLIVPCCSLEAFIFSI